MKKKIALALIAAGVGLSFSAFAEPKAVPANGAVDANNDCTLLSENIKVNLSSGVKGAFNCDVATNTIWVGTCHTAGSRNSSLKCAQVGVDGNDNPVYNHPDCDAQGVTDGKTIEGSPDFRGFFAQTSGGSVAPAFLNGNCTDQILVAHDKLQGK